MISDRTIILFTISLMLLFVGLAMKWQERRDRRRSGRSFRISDE
ncbi:hypothetical protein [Sphingomonas bacterium]|nr:hypothetical protein [Sphingomonas bacterium]